MNDRAVTMGQHQTAHERLQPGDLARLLLASGQMPRRRARDQRPDRAGLELKQKVLQRLAAHDPEPDNLDAVLVKIIDEFGPPTGPTRAIAESIRQDWESACADPRFIEHLLTEAIHGEKAKRKGKQRDQQASA